MGQPRKPRGTRGGDAGGTSTPGDAPAPHIPETPPIVIERSPEVSDLAAARRAAKGRASVDETGFAKGSVPQVSTQQAKWIALKTSTGSDLAATQRLGLDFDTVMQWFNDPDFVAIHDEILENRREGFKSLTTSILPDAFLTLLEVMTTGEKDADRVKAATMILRNQGLLVDKAQTQDAGALASLLADLRSPRPVIKTLPPGTINAAPSEDGSI